MKNIIIIATLLLSSFAQAATLADVVSAKCINEKVKTDFLTFDVTNQIIRGRFAALAPMTNEATGEDRFVELQKNMPDIGYSAYGSLVMDERQHWGSMFLVTRTGRVLRETELMDVFFTDDKGNAQVAQLVCALKFK